VDSESTYEPFCVGHNQSSQRLIQICQKFTAESDNIMVVYLNEASHTFNTISVLCDPNVTNTYLSECMNMSSSLGPLNIILIGCSY
jgi:hypothetical protein